VSFEMTQRSADRLKFLQDLAVSTSPKIFGMLACSDDEGVVGKEGHSPWSIAEEYQLYRREIEGQVILCGRMTWQCMEDVHTHATVVFSRNANAELDVVGVSPGGLRYLRRGAPAGNTTPHAGGEALRPGDAILCSSIDEFCATLLPWLASQYPYLMLTGGPVLVSQFVERGFVDGFMLSRIYRTYEGDSALDLKMFDGPGAYFDSKKVVYSSAGDEDAPSFDVFRYEKTVVRPNTSPASADGTPGCCPCRFLRRLGGKRP